MPVVGEADLRAFAGRILVACGLAPADAAAVAAGLVFANLRGVDSHGVLRLIQYERTIAAGEVNPDPEVKVIRRRGAIALIDAGGGYGFLPTALAMDTAVDLARSFGVGVAGVRNSHHFGMAATYVLRAAEAGMIGILFTTTQPIIAPPGGREGRVGNNPYAVGIPGDPPIVLDMALSEVAYGRIRLAAAEGRPIPLGWAFDREGRPTTDSAEALAAGLLAPIGGYKGYGLSVVAEVLAGVLTGSPFAQQSHAHAHRAGGVGHLALALDPEAFLDRDAFLAGLRQLEAEIRSVPLAAGTGAVYLPGEIERQRLAERRAAGIPISAELAGQLDDLAKRLGVRGLR